MASLVIYISSYLARPRRITVNYVLVLETVMLYLICRPSSHLFAPLSTVLSFQGGTESVQRSHGLLHIITDHLEFWSGGDDLHTLERPPQTTTSLSHLS